MPSSFDTLFGPPPPSSGPPRHATTKSSGIFVAAPAPAPRPRSASRPRDSGIFSGGPAPARARQPLAAKPRDVLVLGQGSYRPTSAERKDSTRLDPVACRTAGAPREKELTKELPGLPLRPRNGAVGRNLSTSAEGGVFGGGPAPVPKPYTVEALLAQHSPSHPPHPRMPVRRCHPRSRGATQAASSRERRARLAPLPQQLRGTRSPVIVPARCVRRGRLAVRAQAMAPPPFHDRDVLY
uniref:Uncharacterized protein n=1 Tax=Emiliania huxleyi TaxID=2903 RepID=A0A7S3WRC3_EMIHU